MPRTNEPTTMQDVQEAMSPQSIVDKIVMMLTNPRAARQLMRYSNGTTGAPTLMFKPQNDFTFDYTNVVTDAQIPAREVMFILRKDPVIPLIFFYWNPNPAAPLTWSYQWYANNYLFRNGPSQSLFFIPCGQTDLEPYSAHSVVPATWQPHGPVLYPLRSKLNPHRWMWVDANDPTNTIQSITFTTFNGIGLATPVAVGQFINIKLYAWNGVEEELFDDQIITAGQGSVTNWAPSGGAYIRVEVFNSDPANTVSHLKVVITDTCSCWSHMPINNINNIAESLSAERVITATLKVTNASSPGFAAGMIYAADVFNGQPWTSLNKGSAQIGTLDTVETRPASKGYYGFCRVEMDDDFQMLRNMSINALSNQRENSQQIFGDLDQDAPYKIVSFILPPPGTFPTDRFLNIELTSVLEGMGNTDLVEPEYPIATPEQWQAALYIFSSIPTNYENPTHWRDILAAIGKVGSVVTPPVAEFLRGVEAGPPMMVMLAQALGNFGLPLLQKGFQALKGLKRKKQQQGMVQNI